MLPPIFKHIFWEEVTAQQSAVRSQHLLVNSTKPDSAHHKQALELLYGAQDDVWIANVTKSILGHLVLIVRGKLDHTEAQFHFRPRHQAVGD